jgi:hypothetical protein
MVSCQSSIAHERKLTTESQGRERQIRSKAELCDWVGCVALVFPFYDVTM